MTKTKDPDNLRGRVDELMKEWYYSNPMAGKSFDVKLLGKKVGTYSLTVSKPTEQRTRLELNIDDKVVFRKWCEDNGFMCIDMKAVEEHFEDSGEVPNGCKPVEVVIPADEGGIIERTALKVEPKLVADILGNNLAEATVALLEGGFDE